MLKIIYYIFLIIVLFFRNKVERKPNFDIYLFEWLNLIFLNKTIFKNIVGNIVIFIPLGFYNKTIDSLIIIFLIEIMQFLLKRGIFDVVDIILNFLGVMIGRLGDDLIGRKRRGIN